MDSSALWAASWICAAAASASRASSRSASSVMEAVLAKSTSASMVSFVASAASCCLSANSSVVSDEESSLVSMRSSACLTFSAASRACSGKVRTYCRIVARACSTPALRAAIAESYSRSMSERSASAAIICSSRQRRDETRPRAALNSLP